MKLTFANGGATPDRDTLTRAAIAGIGETELWLLLALATDESLLLDFASGADAVAATLGIPRAELDQALGFLLGAGILRRESARTRKPSVKPAAEPSKPPRRTEVTELPQYTTDELTALLARRSELRLLIDEAQNALGKIFNQSEIRQLVSIAEGLDLGTEYLLLLLAYCRKLDKKSIRYAEKLAIHFVDSGITTPEALTEHLHKLEIADSAEGQLKRLFGFSRSLTAKEKGFVGDWTCKYGFGADMIEKAFENAAESTANPNLNYLHSILTRWFEEGIKTPLDADRDRENRKATASKATPAANVRSKTPAKATSFDVDDFFAAAIQNGYGDKK